MSSSRRKDEEDVIFSNTASKASTQQPIINTQIAFKDAENNQEESEPKKQENLDQYFREVENKDPFEIAEEHQ